MIITLPSITLTLFLTEKHTDPFTVSLYHHCQHVLPVSWSHTVFSFISQPNSVFLLSHHIVSANTSCLFHGLALFFLIWENSFL